MESESQRIADESDDETSGRSAYNEKSAGTDASEKTL